ncbi:MAG TPA: FemAB family XrtA/PEP-CTERM system-associated protein [Burkholderiaceae bacterium]|nr:FemAB family XrtA/PEP-CTERM system-associated protein [Burkholderiaceae bacterium]
MTDGTVKVRRLEDADCVAWTAFVQACPDATFFHRIEWRDLIENVFGHRTHYLLAERLGEVVGVLPLAQVKSLLFGHALVSLPFAVYGGAAVMDETARAVLHAAAGDLAQHLGADHLELRDRSLCEPGWPQQDLFVTFRKSIEPDADANMLAIPRKQRAMVRKSIERGLASEIDSSVNRFFDLYADNAHRHGTPPFPRRYFEALQRAFSDACEVMTVVTPAGRPVSSVLSFYFRDEVMPYYAGDVLEARELAANDFKYWELMRRACKRGCRVFDYGRSKRGAGSFAFKKNWGFEPQPLHYEYKLFKGKSIPQNNPSNPKYRAVIGLWRHLPRTLVNAIGPSIVRNLG